MILLKDIFEKAKIFLPKELVLMIFQYTIDDSHSIFMQKIIKSLSRFTSPYNVNVNDCFSPWEIVHYGCNGENAIMTHLMLSLKYGHKTVNAKYITYDHIDRGISDENFENFIEHNVHLYPNAEVLMWGQNYGTGCKQVFTDTINKLSKISEKHKLKCIIIFDRQSHGIFDSLDNDNDNDDHDDHHNNNNYEQRKSKFKNIMNDILCEMSEMSIILVSNFTGDGSMKMMCASKSSHFEDLKVFFWKQTEPYGSFKEI